MGVEMPLVSTYRSLTVRSRSSASGRPAEVFFYTEPRH